MSDAIESFEHFEAWERDRGNRIVGPVGQRARAFAAATAMRLRHVKHEAIASTLGVNAETVRAWTRDIPRPPNRQGRRRKEVEARQ